MENRYRSDNWSTACSSLYLLHFSIPWPTDWCKRANTLDKLLLPPPLRPAWSMSSKRPKPALVQWNRHHRGLSRESCLKLTIIWHLLQQFFIRLYKHSNCHLSRWGNLGSGKTEGIRGSVSSYQIHSKQQPSVTIYFNEKSIPPIERTQTQERWLVCFNERKVSKSFMLCVGCILETKCV